MIREMVMCAGLLGFTAQSSCGVLLFRFGCSKDSTSFVCKALSADGRVIAGQNSSGDVVRWTPAEGLTIVGKPPGLPVGINVRSISDDGEVISGYASSSLNKPVFGSFTWSRRTGFILGQDEELLAVARGRKGDVRTNAISLLPDYEKVFIRNQSRDGKVLVGGFGRALANSYEELGFIWQDGIGTTILRDDNNVVFRSAYDVSADNTVVVGDANFPDGQTEAAIWRRDQPIQSVQRILEGSGVRMDSYFVYGAIRVSAGGNVILAVGRDGDCVYETSVVFLENTADMDRDGLGDDWEFAYFGDVRAEASDDPDGDEVSNLEEFKAGTNPMVTDAQPYVAEIVCGDKVCISIPASTEWVYTLQRCDDIVQGNWRDVIGQSAIHTEGSVVNLTDSQPTGFGFYRVVAEINKPN